MATDTKISYGNAPPASVYPARETPEAVIHTNGHSSEPVAQYLPNEHASVRETLPLLLASASQYAGGYVKTEAEMHYLPLLERKDRSPIYLYNLVEIINGLVDYDEILEECPGLSYSQINGAFDFLRRLSQLNTALVDIDAVENEFEAQDVETVMALREAMKAGEPSHVLAAR